MNKNYRAIISASRKFYIENSKKSSTPISVGVIDTGIFPHRILSGHIIDFYDVIHNQINPYDNHGHGTHISGIIGGHGIFPQSSLVGVKVLNEKGNGKITDFIKGIDYLVKQKDKLHIRVINISLGAKYEGTKEQQELIECVEYAWDKGIVICAAAGNNGPEKSSITVPGVSKKIITVGTSDDDIPITANFSDEINVHYSGRGPTSECIVKPDILCPGANILSLNNTTSGYCVKSGTSMSTPMISGILALTLSIYPDFTPKDLKTRIKKAHSQNNFIFDANLFFTSLLQTPF